MILFKENVQFSIPTNETVLFIYASWQQGYIKN